MSNETLDEYAARRRSVPCPDCGAPAGASCADRRTYDGDLFGNRVHPSRNRLLRVPSGLSHSSNPASTERGTP